MMCTNDEYIGTSNSLLFFFGGGEYFETKGEVHQPKDSNFTDVVCPFDVPGVHVSDSL